MHFRAIADELRERAAKCLIQPHHPPINILGGSEFPGVGLIDPPKTAHTQLPIRSDWAPVNPVNPVAGDLVIPDFLKRSAT
jgi:hypothetical protein